MRFLVGGYSADSGGIATGIGVLIAGEPESGSAGGPLALVGEAVSASSPSWVTWNERTDVAYATLEAEGTVQAFRRVGAERFAPLGDPVEAGEAVCHAAVSPDGSTLVATCWGDGRVVRYPLAADGRIGRPSFAPAAVDPAAPGAPTEAVSGVEAAAAEVGIDLAALGLGGRGDAGLFGGRGLDGVGGVDLFGGAGADAVGGVGGGALFGGAGGGALFGGAGGGALFGGVRGGGGVGGVDGTGDAGGDAEAAAFPGPGAERERVSRAHQTVFLSGGLVATSDLGFDLVRFWRLVDGKLRPLHDVVLPYGSGPRHMVWHPSGHLYVVTEYSCEVFVLAPDASGRWRLVSGTPLGAGTLPGDSAAELAASRDSGFLYAGVRGSNTIAVVAVRGAGETLSPVALVEAGVDWPRHHRVVRDTLLIAGERSDDVVSLTLDIRSGIPGRVRHRAPAPSPTCLTPFV
ncbi:6-phosphogluconolactonase (cycloisomerase 2 family) [Microbacterium sp. AK009]|uniref:lactonase family protein n=1 Tax=Microbacterium sp. AK009 TaxID=2723068 RepID=UPI00182D578D|nr:lactonase family protein [Microbacterium sp. AK009]NYF18138.1 6-phosphogluconolactonase (cycloisomerase 2 family) [Microbacterium sp. AK009]